MSVDWKVIVVFDPEHTGHDFAYTIGLHERGLPELFLWARPTDGDDPGADWMLSDLDLALRLNELGRQLVDGTIAPGAAVEVSYDGGSTHAFMTLQEPVAAHRAGFDAFQADVAASLVEVRWTLRQRPIGPRRELDEDEVTTARSRLGAFISAEGAASVAFPASARVGPHTPLVDVLRMSVRSLDDHRAERLLAAALLPHLPECELGAITQAARAAGLVDEVEEAIADASEDACAVADRVFADDPELARSAANLFAAVFAVAYGTELVRHELSGPPPPSSEVMWALLDPDGARTRRFVERASRADPELARIFADPDLVRLASAIDGLDGIDGIDDEAIGDLAGLWVQAAAMGHGSGIWTAALLIDPTVTIDVTWNAGLALATAANVALGVPVPDELVSRRWLIDRITADVHASARFRKAGMIRDSVVR